ncbi:H-2 class I histocompatibility antigen, K-D alpha chain-like [Sapajus apella]|uniref:H-2 class I histocompatibility antigen, K-D alpha chain-like n=1 Tax=Sapajus apella TaxID=9515 RepID=A0A6J3HGR4_SAPAP|nr:H-2 class I histocompatibility antigen, K-D alpha chain-like [Sapajus apella]
MVPVLLSFLLLLGPAVPQGTQDGFHTLQGRFGCEIQNNRSTGASWEYTYDERGYIKFNKEIPAWIPLDPAAHITKKKWEAEPVYVLRAKAYLEEECPATLRKYLNYSKSILDRQGTHCSLLPSTKSRIKDDLKLGAQATSESGLICSWMFSQTPRFHLVGLSSLPWDDIICGLKRTSSKFQAECARKSILCWWVSPNRLHLTDKELEVREVRVTLSVRGRAGTPIPDFRFPIP